LFSNTIKQHCMRARARAHTHTHTHMHIVTCKLDILDFKEMQR